MHIEHVYKHVLINTIFGFKKILIYDNIIYVKCKSYPKIGYILILQKDRNSKENYTCFSKIEYSMLCPISSNYLMNVEKNLGFFMDMLTDDL